MLRLYCDCIKDFKCKFFLSSITGAGDGGTCENDEGCSFGGAVCTSDNCACPEGKFANTQTNSCDNSMYCCSYFHLIELFLMLDLK
jgi:hypothetical protein